ncbi:MAG: hypothetical protein ACHQWU_14790 [Gemmatimonadales bacterium]
MLSASTAGTRAAHCQLPSSVDGLPGRRVTVVAVPAEIAGRTCLSLGDDIWAPDIRESRPCRPLGIRTLGRAAGVDWSYGVYDRAWSIPAAAGAPPDTVQEIEIVLFTSVERERDHSRTSGSRLAPVWHDRFERDVLRSMTPDVVPTVGGGALISLMQCVNGTGGCSHEAMLVRDSQWRPVKLGFLDSLQHQFPGAVRHGFRLDVHTLAADAALYSDTDANCCPSRSAEMTLRLRGDSLTIVTLRLRSTPLPDDE